METSDFIEKSLSAIQSSPVECLGEILRMIRRTVNCEFGVILTVDEQKNQLALDVVTGYPSGESKRRRSDRLRIDIILGKSVSTEAYIEARDMGEAKPKLTPGDNPLSLKITAADVKEILAFPIKSMGEWVGVLTLESLKEGVLKKIAETQEGLKLLNVFSDVISMALAARQSLIFRFDEFIKEFIKEKEFNDKEFNDVESVSQQALAWVFKKFNVNTCAIYSIKYDEKTGEDYVSCMGAFVNKEPEADVEGIRFEMEEGFTGWVAQAQHSLILTAVDNEKSKELDDYEENFGRRPVWVGKLGARHPSSPEFKSYIGVPITDGRETFGVLEVLDEEREYAFSDEGLLEMIARRLATEYKRISTIQKRESLFEISKFGAGDRETVIDEVVKMAMKVAAATHGFFMHKEDDGSFTPLSVRGYSLNPSNIPVVKPDEQNLITWVMGKRKEFSSPNLESERKNPRGDIPQAYLDNSFKPNGFIPTNIRSLLMVPVFLGNKQQDETIEELGVLILMSAKLKAFQQDEVVVTALAQIVGYHIWASRKIPELQSKDKKITQLTELMPHYERATIAAGAAAGSMHTVRDYVKNVSKALTGLLAHPAVRQNEEVLKLAAKIKKPFDDLTAFYERLFKSVYGEMKPVFELCDMAELVQEVWDYMEPTIKGRKIAFKSHLKDAQLPKVQADSILMKVVFINLINNSIGATARNINIYGKKVTGFAENQFDLELTFKDDGIGIPKHKVDANGDPAVDENDKPIDNWKTIFKPFETAHKKEGTGLGLAVNAEILNKHQGKIKVIESTVDGPEHGTSIAVYLPLKH